jgi:UDP-N-acetylglucosamine 4,6-dehydratase/5-epimerase
MKDVLKDKIVLVTGGTGSFGQAFIRHVLASESPRKVIVLSRDEWKQSEMKKHFTDPRLRYFLGDVRDLARLQRAFDGVHVVVHAAALKQVDTLEYNPFEAVKTNIMGSENVITAAIDQNVERVIALSTDKAVNPLNLYGATKLCAEKLFQASNSYAGDHKTIFSVVRYGNVVGSRGSVVPLFFEKRKTGRLPITDKRMTRFWITLEESVHLVLLGLSQMKGGEIFIPKIPSMRITDLARAIGPDCKIEEIGIRPGEKIHEVLMTEDESSRALDHGDCFVINPTFAWRDEVKQNQGKALPEGFLYSSDNNKQWLKEEEMLKMVEAFSK